jgi:hypothetical protein
MKDWTALEVAKCRTPGTWRVSRNLYLQVEPAGDGQGITKSWICRYMLDARARSMGLGSLELVSLAEARDRAVAARKLLLDGVDPIEGWGRRSPRGRSGDRARLAGRAETRSAADGLGVGRQYRAL